jgi:hypothetical protein
MALQVLQAAADASREFEWRWDHFDSLLGSIESRQALLAGASVSEIEAAWRPALDRFAEERESVLLYGD